MTDKKQCVRCRETKDFKEFYKATRCKYGLDRFCKSCRYIVNKGYRKATNKKHKDTKPAPKEKVEDLQNEIWKDIVEYEGLYQVSNLGRVKSLSKTRVSNGGNYTSKEKILKYNIAHNGYFRITLCKNAKPKHFPAHRLVANAFIPNQYDKEQINHIDGNKENNNVSNLEWATPKENIKHALDNGLLHPLKGDKCHFYKSEIRNIRVKCITTNRIFKSAKVASKFYKAGHSRIIACCKGKALSSGTLEDGTKLTWCYAKEGD